MAMVAASARASALTADEHVLIKKRGDVLYRHGVAVSDAWGTSHQVLTPSRVVELVDFTGKSLVGVKLWDGKSLPRSLRPPDATVARDSTLGYFGDGRARHQRAEDDDGGGRRTLLLPFVYRFCTELYRFF